MSGADGSRTVLLLVRHGQTDWNLEGRYQGRTDVPLNAVGREQAERLAAELAAREIGAVYSSTLRRSLETAVAIARAHGLEVRPDPRLVEIDQGEWEGVLSTRIAERYPGPYRRWCEDPRTVRPPGGESIAEVHDRVISAVEEMVERHPGETLCLVTHKTAIVVIRTHYLGLDLREEMGRMPRNASWERLEVVAPASAPWVPGARCCSAAARVGSDEVRPASPVRFAEGGDSSPGRG